MLFVTILLGVVLLILFATTGCTKLSKNKLTVLNYGEYIDRSVIKQFEQETGAEVIYDEFYNNEDMYTKVKVNSYDVVCLSDYMVSRMSQEDMLCEINVNDIPNYVNISSNYKNLEYDPQNKFSIPYVTGTVGILYNKNKITEGIDTWEAVFSPAYSGEIFMIDSMRDAVGIALKYLGYSMNSEDPNEIDAAKNLLIKQKSLILAYGNDELKDKMLSGEGSIAVMYSTQILAAIAYSQNCLVYVVPKEGSNMWVDSWVVMKNTSMECLALKWLNFLCRPDIAKKNADFIQCATPNVAVFELLDDVTKNNLVLYPPEEVLFNCETFKYSPKTSELYHQVWTKVKVARSY